MGYCVIPDTESGQNPMPLQGTQTAGASSPAETEPSRHGCSPGRLAAKHRTVPVLGIPTLATRGSPNLSEAIEMAVRAQPDLVVDECGGREA